MFWLYIVVTCLGVSCLFFMVVFDVCWLLLIGEFWYLVGGCRVLLIVGCLLIVDVRRCCCLLCLVCSVWLLCVVVVVCCCFV